MNCPVCNKELEFDLTDLEDFYYDCSVCNSSLSFQKGNCEVISRGQAPQSQINSSETQVYGSQEESILSQSIKQSSAQPLKEAKTEEFRTHPKDRDQSRQSNREDPNIKPSHIESSNEKLSSLQSPSFPQSASYTGSPSSSESPSSPESPSSLRKQESPFQQENTLKESNQGPAVETNPSQTYTNEAFSEDPVSLTDEITEVPEIEEDGANEFIEPETEENLEENLEENEASFIFKEDEEELEPAKEDFSEVVEFSKNKKRQEKGLYLYKLFLSEINSRALKEKVISVLEEEYLEMDLQECPSYKESIKHKGKIDLPNLSPIQVYVILHHLMGLPLKIYWEQSHIADS